MDESKVTGDRFVISRCDSAETFKVMKEALDEVAKTIEFFVIAPSFLSGSDRRDDNLEPSFVEFGNRVVGIVGHVGKASLALDEVHESNRHRRVVLVSGSRKHLQRPTLGVCDRMQFRRRPTSGPSYCVFLGPPLPPEES